MQFDQQEHLSNIKTSNKGQQSCYDRLFVRCSFFIGQFYHLCMYIILQDQTKMLHF